MFCYIYILSFWDDKDDPDTWFKTIRDYVLREWLYHKTDGCNCYCKP